MHPPTPWLSHVGSRLARSRHEILATPASQRRRFSSTPRLALIIGRRSLASNQSPIFQVSPELQHAFENYQPIVALETAIYTHGFPYPENVQLAFDLEKIVRNGNAIPATIGIIDGVAKIGLTSEEIVRLAESAGKPETMKVSRRDLPYILGIGKAGRKLNGGTTVSGTMLLAYAAGINVFGTGGLGGVHRGGQDSMDISADLTELGRTNVAVVSSGCKSFLDIPRTLEYLETQGVCVSTYAPGTDLDVNFPAFFTRDSGVKSPNIFRDPAEAAAIIYASKRFSAAPRSGLLFANPIPEKFAIPKADIDLAISQAVQEAEEKGIRGHANTPFILSRIKDLTQGTSVAANRELVSSNVDLATRIAVQVSLLKKADLNTQPGIRQSRKDSERSPAIQVNRAKAVKEVQHPPNILVLGSVAIDLSCNVSSSSPTLTPQLRTSNPGFINSSIGGVGHNVALAAHHASPPNTVQLLSLVGDDLAGQTILSSLREEGLDTSGIRTVAKNVGRTAQYVAINDASKDLLLAMADMDIFSSTDAPNLLLSRNKSRLASPIRKLGKLKKTSKDSVPPSTSAPLPEKRKWAVVDANLGSTKTPKYLQELKNIGWKTIFEPVSAPKSSCIFAPSSPSETPISIFPNNTIDLATPNEHELEAMHKAAKQNGYFETPEWWKIIDALGIPASGARDRFVKLVGKELTDKGLPIMAVQLLPFIPTVVAKLGEKGVFVTELLDKGDERLTDPKYAQWILSRGSEEDKSVGGIYMRLYPATAVKKIVSVNGAGDTFLGVLVAGLARGAKVDESLIDFAQEAARLSLESKLTVPETVKELRERMIFDFEIMKKVKS